jgi:hypothetical protein
MPIFEFARRPPQWLRVALAAMLLGFALNSIAHVAHQHDATPTAAAHSLACGHCASFGALADGPRHTYLVSEHRAKVGPTLLPSLSIRSFELLTSARPRAPPVS